MKLTKELGHDSTEVLDDLEGHLRDELVGRQSSIDGLRW
jgi:hypothetical protein